MPIHDWTRVSAGIFHSFHVGWIGEMTRVLNGGMLPADYYALAEPRAASFEPDILALERRDPSLDQPTGNDNKGGGIALATAPPKARLVDQLGEAAVYASKRRTISVRHSTGDRIVALLEIASPGNKDRRQAVDAFVHKALAGLDCGYHLVVIDPLPPGRHDPAGLAGEIWEASGGNSLGEAVSGMPSAAAFRAAVPFQCYCEPFHPKHPLPPIPLFYHPDYYVDLPLEATYMQAYQGVPKRWREVIEG